VKSQIINAFDVNDQEMLDDQYKTQLNIMPIKSENYKSVDDYADFCMSPVAFGVLTSGSIFAIGLILAVIGRFLVNLRF